MADMVSAGPSRRATCHPCNCVAETGWAGLFTQHLAHQLSAQGGRLERFRRIPLADEQLPIYRHVL